MSINKQRNLGSLFVTLACVGMGSCQIEIQIQRQKNKLSIVFDGQELLDLFVEFKLIKKDILKKKS